MFNLKKNKKTQWETIEELKVKKLGQKDLLLNELQKIDNDIRAALLNEKDTGDLIKTKNTIQTKLRNIADEISILEEEQSKVQLDHHRAKLDEVQEEINIKLEEIKPHRAKYEAAKKQFEKTESEWFEINSGLSGQIKDLSTKKENLRAIIDSIEHNASNSEIE